MVICKSMFNSIQLPLPGCVTSGYINRLYSVRFSSCHFITGPFDNGTQIYHLNTRLVRYSDGYCILSNILAVKFDATENNVIIVMQYFCFQGFAKPL